ncbi:transcriptional regulator [Limnobacter humi]|uniref:Transcriptional regulator n=1 Tax=Limnobacter humi TaxID=1778671 RepID=A0ABT1WC71_9BURK|nr:CsgG/HfaB family protein [Limnobacter humi]MCQ8895114.1 transcriptional regulator [Limnobacter humi]
MSNTQYVNALDGASVVENTTRYSKSLECLKPLLASRGGLGKRYAVGRVNDFSGKEDLTNGKRLTQGAALMVISALSKTGVPMVERFDTSIADMELKYADNKLITDNPETKDHRRIFSGSLPGSDYHIVGGITEVNYNIKSGSIDSSIRFLGLGARYFVMDVAVDLRLVNTKTLEIVNTQSLQKQIIGTELSGGYFRLFSDGLVDINAAERTQEPIQKGVRMVIEQAVFNMLTQVNHVGASQCARLSSLNPADNPQPTAMSKPAANNGATLTPKRSDAPLNLDNTASPGNTGREGVMIDPQTGEVVPLGSTPSPQQLARPLAAGSEAGNQEVRQLNGLFGPPGLPSDAGNANNRAMQEKLLYGSRPELR